MCSMTVCGTQLLNWHRKLSWKHTRVCWQLSWRQQSCLLPALTWRKYCIYAILCWRPENCVYHRLLASPTRQLSIDNCLSFVCGRRKAQHDTHSLPPQHEGFWTRLLTIIMYLQIGSKNTEDEAITFTLLQQPSCRLVPTSGIHQSMVRVPRSIDRQATQTIDRNSPNHQTQLSYCSLSSRHGLLTFHYLCRT